MEPAARTTVQSDGARLLNDEDPGGSNRVSDVLVTVLGDKDASGLQPDHMAAGLVAIVHVDCSIENNEDLDAIIDVPDIGFISPVKPHRGIRNASQVNSGPRPVECDITSSNDLHRAPAFLSIPVCSSDAGELEAMLSHAPRSNRLMTTSRLITAVWSSRRASASGRNDTLRAIPAIMCA